IARRVVHRVIERAMLRQLRQIEEVGEKHHVVANRKSALDGACRRGAALRLRARRGQSEKTSDESASGVPPLPGAEIEHKRNMAGKAAFAGGGRKDLHEACLTDAGFAANADDPAMARL